jgi:hypothetical protein
MNLPAVPVLRWLAHLAASVALLSGCGLFGYERLDLASGPIATHCGDRVLDGDETDVDCGGGTCPACELDPGCGADSGVGCGGSQCSLCETCSDGVENQDETGIDCGGSLCAACAGAVCLNPSDCGSSVCVDSACRAASCTDGVLNQDETGIDCGGSSCAACTATPTCFDGLQNQDETGIDCGGSQCGICPGPTCSDGLQNQDETGIDCGGSSCAACAATPTCSDGLQNQDETGIDCGGSTCAACGANTPPLARMLVTPGLGSNDGTPTLFQGDASASSDPQDSPGALSYSWDWDNDGVVDAIGLNSTHIYPAAGTYEASLRVQDTGGLSDTTTFLVIVTTAINLVRVTTPLDENDSGATPGSPNGTGLSLREAITFANAVPGKQSILVPAGFSIALGSQLPSPTDPAGVDLVGDGVVWDGTGTGAADDCIQTAAAQTRIFGFEIRNCRRSPLRLAVGAAGSQLSRLNIHDNSQAVVLRDTNVIFGPNNEVSRSADHCISVVGQADTIAANYIHDCATRGIDLTGNSANTLLIGNVIARSDPGIFFGAGADNCVLWHNVVHANLGDGIWVGSSADTGIQLRNNILSGNAGYGLRATDSAFIANDHNDYFGNVLGTCDACSSLGAGSLQSDPLYLSAAANDYRLQLSSPNVNAGIDTGADVNGPEPGNGLFNGSNPDIGAHESP